MKQEKRTRAQKVFFALLLVLSTFLAIAKVTAPPPVLIPTTFGVQLLEVNKDVLHVKNAFQVSNTEVKTCRVHDDFKRLYAAKVEPQSKGSKLLFYQVGRETADNSIEQELAKISKKHNRLIPTVSLSDVYQLMKPDSKGGSRPVWDGARRVIFYVRDTSGKVSTVLVTKTECGFEIDATNNLLKKDQPKHPHEMVRKQGDLVAVRLPK